MDVVKGEDMKKVKIGPNEYEIIEDYKDGFDLEKTLEKYTDYFDNYDYIIGDWAYGKLRLKGFYDSKNKKCKKINDISNKEKYIKDQCAYECRYFVLKKVGGENGDK